MQYMKTYYLTHKGAYEKIHTVSRKDYTLENAIDFFAKCKKLSKNQLLEIFEVHEEE